MVEFTTQFCDSASFSQTALRQYGRYEKDADFTQLPILNEHTVITYITEGSGSSAPQCIPSNLAPSS